MQQQGVDAHCGTGILLMQMMRRITVLNGVFYHIGLKYFDGAYRWTDGSATTYFDWGTGEGSDSGKDCVRTDQNKWRDTVCGGPIGYICQSTAYCTGNSGTCQNEGSCVSYRWCECADGFYGDTCLSNEYCPNNVNPCQNGGSCENMPGTDPYYKCNCKPGYFNVTCSSDEYCPNNPDTCQNGSCKNTRGEYPYYECDCMPGFFGYNCSSDEYCPNNVVNPCQNGGICENSPGTFPYYECACTPGYFNDICSSDEYCPNNQNPCQNGICENTPKQPPYYECDCMPGFFGYNCSSDQYCDHNDNPCLNGGICVSVNDSDAYYKCDCSAGYFSDICSKDLIKIQTIKSLIAIAEGNAILLFNVTTYDGLLTVELHRDISSEIPIYIQNNVTNGTAQFILQNIDKSSEGNYIFIAYSSSNDYQRNDTTELIIHVNVSITNINPYTIFSPVTTGPRHVVCNASGYPSPTKTTWMINGVNVSLQEGSGVYQYHEETHAILYIAEAQLSDDGNYTCSATNYVGEGATEVFGEDNTKVSVYGSPHIIEVNETPCSSNGTLTIRWTPNNQTIGINHIFTVTSQNSTTSDNTNETAVDGKDVEFNNLHPFTEYLIKAEVCPDECITKLNDTSKATTGHGLPGLVNNPKIQMKSTDICHVSWEISNTPDDQILQYEIAWNQEYVYKPPNTETLPSQIAVKVPASGLEYYIETESNRQYSVNITAYTCAGAGLPVAAEGECITESEGPNEVVEPIIRESNGDLSTRDIDITIPNEENGPISCVFVIANQGNLANSNKPFEIEDLEKAASQESVSQGVEYLAIAIPRATIGNDKIYTTTLGDDEINLECDLTTIWSSENIKKRSARATSQYSGNNWPLKADGASYSFYTVTSTPTSKDVIFGKSEITSFVNGSVPMGWIAAVVICPILIIVIMGGMYYMWRKRQAKKIPDDYAMGNQPATNIPDAPLYENVESITRPETDIPLGMLHSVYKMLKADENMQFREQYQEIKTKSKANAPPTTVGGSEEMMTKNRYKNILPYDTSRVSLKGQGVDGYINACYVNGIKKQFIATQGPLPNTKADFWRMVVEQNCTIIVMLTKCVEAGKIKCEQYWPNVNESVQQGSFIVRNEQEIYYGGFVRRILVIQTPHDKNITVQQYQFLKWPDHGVPVTTSSFFRLQEAVMETYGKTRCDAPILVHCSAGVGRTGTFIGYDILQDQAKDKSSVDVFNCVMKMRSQRVDMVQTCDQYDMLHKLMLERYMFGETDVTREQFIVNQQTGKGSTRKPNIQKEFENLAFAESLNQTKKEDDHVPRIRNRVVIVRQPEDTEWISIDANYIEAYNKNAQIIAAQGPYKSTVEYFWRAVLDNSVNTIVMVDAPGNDATSQDESVCYWPKSTSETLQLNFIKIQLEAESRRRGNIERRFKILRTNQPQRIVTQYQYPDWSLKSVPEDATGILDLVYMLQSDSTWETNGATMVHCSDGLGRTGVFCTILNVIDRLKYEGRIDIFRTVKDLRDNRPGVVKTLEQYNFCYKAVKTYLSSTNVYSNDALEVEEEDQDPIYENV
uniref:receptor-type tyrosine-protein phosphatase mu-like n=1 Tax=Styela clava TaxID=7725 RepID=UPI00193A117A|nr:receptor-type tyrosine-protein phosphatase mu-like [Styela clava]